MVRAGEGFSGLGWEAEKRQQDKAAEVNSVPGSSVGSWHGTRQWFGPLITLPLLMSLFCEVFGPRNMHQRL